MAFKIRPFSELIAMSKEKLDEALAPVRARSARARAAVATADLEEKMLTLERQIHEACADKDIDFDAVIRKINEYELAERKFKQITKLVADLFPPKKAARVEDGTDG